jgi:hypothetical protein
MIFFFASEVSYFMKLVNNVLSYISDLRFYLIICPLQETHDYFYVNTTRSSSMHVSFDISFHEIPCKLLSVDVVDDVGGVQKDTNYQIFKHRLSKTGEKEGLPEPHDLGNGIHTEEHFMEGLQHEELKDKSKTLGDIMKNEAACGNCYGAGKPNECCNSCEDVKAAYKRVGWRFKPHEVAQCEREVLAENLKSQFAEDGGCQLYGKMELNKASGHFHIVPHNNLRVIGGNKGNGNNGLLNLLELLSFTFDQFNITHTVNSLSFGDHFPGIKSPLDGETRSIKDTHGMYQYYVKIVPTQYIYYDGREVHSNQYSVTEHVRNLAPGSGRGMPGIYFYYQLSPLNAKFEEKRRSFLTFLTSACAILGGCFTVMGIVDVIMNSLLRCFNKSLL